MTDRLEAMLRQGHPDVDRYVPPAFAAVPARARAITTGATAQRPRTSAVLGIAAALAVALVVVVVGAAVLRSTQLPTASPTPVASPTNAAPSSQAPTGSHIEVHWEQVLEEWEIHALAATEDGGWVGLGNCLVDGQFDESCGVAVTSSDGETWTEHSIQHAEVLKQSYQLTRAGDRWLSINSHVWSSPDGVAWTRGDAIVRNCCRDGQPFYADITAAPNGSLVAWALGDGGATIGPVVSDDGVAWDLVDQAQFGSDTFRVDEIAAVGPELLLSGGACQGCIDGIWSSTDGRTWTEVLEPAIPQGGSTSFASDGATTIATISACPTYAGCQTRMWSSANGGPWSTLFDGMNVRNAHLVDTDAGFVAIGNFDHKYVQFASIDGRTWTEVENDGLPPYYDDEDCEIGTAEALHDTIVIVSGQCGWWRGTVEVTAGPGTPPAPEATPEPIPSVAVATLGPGQSLDATAVLGDVCLYEPGKAEIPIVVTWDGNVPIGSINVGIDGDGGGTIGFPANGFGTNTFTNYVRTTVPHTARVTLGAAAPPGSVGAIVKVIDLSFTVDPENACT